jgi:osmoprotectant transport system ATP-binding protein
VEEALRLADRILVLRTGRIVQYDAPLTILSRPADAFVRELVGSDDLVRQLGLVRVESAMQPWSPGLAPAGQPTIRPDESLRQALSLLLRPDTTALVVTQQDQPIGLLTLDSIRAVTEQSNRA